MAKRFRKLESTKGIYVFKCLGCNEEHQVWTKPEGYQHPVWGFNEDLEKPTVTPSLKVEYKMPDKTDICHSFITDGKIQYLSDCTHHLAGQTIDLPEYDE